MSEGAQLVVLGRLRADGWNNADFKQLVSGPGPYFLREHPFYRDARNSIKHWMFKREIDHSENNNSSYTP